MVVEKSWQLDQLKRIGERTPERLDELLTALWNRYPNLLEELVIMAIDEGQINLETGSEMLELPSSIVQAKLEHFHNTGDHRIDLIDGVAKLVNSGIAVWEVAREFKEAKTVEALASAYPGLPMSEIKAALRYAEAHPGEIETMIQKFERVAIGRYVR